MKNLILSFFLVFSLPCFSQSIQWAKCFGGNYTEGSFSSWQEMGGKILKTGDGNYVLAGNSTSNDGDVSGNHGQSDAWILKFDSLGTIIWQTCVGGTEKDILTGATQASGGGYVFCGYNYTPSSGITWFWIFKLDEAGNLLWEKQYKPSTTSTDNYNYAYVVSAAKDGGYYVAGQARTTIYSNNGDNVWVLKLDSAGALLWDKVLGGSFADGAYAAAATNDNGCVVAGVSLSNDGDVTGHHGNTGSFFDSWVIKLDSTGTIQWQKSLGGTAADEPRDVKQTTDGNYVVAGYTVSNDGDVSGNHTDSLFNQPTADYWIVKLDSTGAVLWQKCLGGTGVDQALSITERSNGNLVVCGNSTSNNGDVSGNHMYFTQPSVDYWAVEIDSSSGNKIWQNSLGGTSYDNGLFAIETNGSLLVSGTSSSTDGDVTGLHGSAYDYWVVSIAGLSGTEDGVFYRSGIRIFPNPARTHVTISSSVPLPPQAEFMLYDLPGREILRTPISSGQVDLAASMTPGMYLYKITSNDNGTIGTGKIVLE